VSPRCLRCKAGSEWIEGSPLDAHANVLLLRAEVRALRRERRALRAALREAIEQMDQRAHYMMRDVIQRMSAALKPRKARGRKA